MKFRQLTDLFKLTTPYAEPEDIKSKNSDTQETVEKDTKDNSQKVRVKQEPNKEIFSWEIKVDPFYLPKRIVRSIFVFVFLFSIFLILVRDWPFLILVLSISFLFNLILNSPPKNLKYTLYSNGIDYDGMFLSWDELNYYFYYEGKKGLLIITSQDVLPGRIYVYFDEKDTVKIDETLNTYLNKKPYHPKDFFEFIIFKIKPYINLSEKN